MSAIVQHVPAGSAANAVTVAVTVAGTTAGSLLVAVPTNLGTRTVTGVSDGTTAFTQATGAVASAAGGVLTVDGWYILACAAGRTVITATFSGAAGTFNKGIVVYEVSGFAACAFDLAAVANNQTGSATQSVGASLLTTSPGGYTVGGLCSNKAVDANPLAGNEFTSGGDLTFSGSAACSLLNSTAAAHQPVWGQVSATFCATTLAFKDAALGAADRGTPRGLQRGIARGLACARDMVKLGNLWQPADRRLVIPVGIAFTGA